MGRGVGQGEPPAVAEIVEVGGGRPLPGQAEGIDDSVSLLADRPEIGPDRLRLARIAVRVEEPDPRVSAEAIHLAQVLAGIVSMVGPLHPFQIRSVEAQCRPSGVVRVDDVAGTDAHAELLENGARLFGPVGRRRETHDGDGGHGEESQ